MTLLNENLNREFAYTTLFRDLETQEELRSLELPTTEGFFLVIKVGNRDGTRKWKHSIKTEEI